ncbi:hypothetical protein LX99_04719 [Mucilaginibacter oryzae]|uniref:Uncharacterized protein n=1 Tax=Mucilaginibacter oryzae TaxID=468058 RepID=A0A316GY36_9SPHI|nr:hypothetical protein [Mucilaginibacter oryzae]PWK69220.1 hypothetical protein LX99_04719 [Mucilaginibacter oryzae]
MDENRLNILNESNRMLSKLQLLSVFFEDELIYKIYLRTQVIHKLFETNPELDINKLELFHLQFTASLVDLLRKIKKNNEANVSLVFDEIELTREMIDKMEDNQLSEQSYKIDQQRQALKINLSLRKLYQVLSDNSADYPFSKNINAFSLRYAPDFFFNINPELYTELINYNYNDTYHNTYATIQRKLMGILNKYAFRSEFYCGLKAGNLVLEVYRLLDEDRHFLFSPANNLFLFCDVDKLDGIDRSNNLSRKERLMHELQNKTNKLQSDVTAMKTQMPAEIKSLLAENYKKLNDINFLQNISEIDVQANILKSMLNTDII